MTQLSFLSPWCRDSTLHELAHPVLYYARAHTQQETNVSRYPEEMNSSSTTGDGTTPQRQPHPSMMSTNADNLSDANVVGHQNNPHSRAASFGTL
jgi:hypothetical protein